MLGSLTVAVCAKSPRHQETPLYGGVGVRCAPVEPFLFMHICFVDPEGRFIFCSFLFCVLSFILRFDLFLECLFLLFGRLFAKGVFTR